MRCLAPKYVIDSKPMDSQHSTDATTVPGNNRYNCLGNTNPVNTTVPQPASEPGCNANGGCLNEPVSITDPGIYDNPTYDPTVIVEGSKVNDPDDDDTSTSTMTGGGDVNETDGICPFDKKSYSHRVKKIFLEILTNLDNKSNIWSESEKIKVSEGMADIATSFRSIFCSSQNVRKNALVNPLIRILRGEKPEPIGQGALDGLSLS